MQLDDRYQGMSVKYDERSDTLVHCAPGSISNHLLRVVDHPGSTVETRDEHYDNNAFGHCSAIERYSRNPKYHKVSEFVRDPREDDLLFYSKDVFRTRMLKNFGYSVNFIREDQGLITTAPGTNYWSGSFQYGRYRQDSNGKNDLIKFTDIQPQISRRLENLEDDSSPDSFIDEVSDEVFEQTIMTDPVTGKRTQRDDPGYHLGTASKYLRCGQSQRKFVFISGTHPTGFIVVYELVYNIYGKLIVAEDKLFLRSYDKSKSQSVSGGNFGRRFGFSFDLLKIRERDFLLVSSPFGETGSLELFEVACPTSDHGKLRMIPRNEKLVGAPNDVKLLGYQVVTVGNIDPASGDEVVVSAPNKQGQVFIFSVRGDELKLVQSVSTSSVEYLGLAISPNAVDLDNTAGKDIVVSGKDSIVVILSKPTFSLKRDVEFNYKNNGKNGVYIEDVVANGAEKLQICLDITSNVQNMDKLDITASLTLDSTRSPQTKRFSFADKNFKKSIKFTYNSRSKRFCSADMVILRQSKQMMCPDDKFLSVGEDITFALENIKSEKEIQDGLFATFTDSETYKTNGAISPKWQICYGSRQCTNRITIQDTSSTPVKLQVAAKETSKQLDLKIINREKQLHNTYIKLSTDANDNQDQTIIRIDHDACKNVGKGEWKCHYGQSDTCTLKPQTEVTVSFNVTIDTVNSASKSLKLKYELIKDGASVSSGVKEYQIGVDLNIIIHSPTKQPIKFDPTVEGAQEERKLLTEIKVENNNEVVNFLKYTTTIKIPTFFYNEKNQKIQIWDQRKGYSILNKENVQLPSSSYRVVKTEPKTRTPEPKVTDLAPGKADIGYDTLIIASGSDQLLGSRQNIVFKVGGDVMQKDMFGDMDTSNSRIVSHVKFEVEKISGVAYSERMEVEGKVEERDVSLAEYQLNKPPTVDTSMVIYGIAGGLLFLIIVIIILVATKTHKKEIFFKTDEGAPQPEEIPLK